MTHQELTRVEQSVLEVLQTLRPVRRGGERRLTGGARARKLVGARVEDRADQRLESIAVLHEIPGQPVEQLWIGGWVGVPEIVNGLHDAAAQQVEPDAVDHRAGEVA